MFKANHYLPTRQFITLGFINQVTINIVFIWVYRLTKDDFDHSICLTTEKLACG